MPPLVANYARVNRCKAVSNFREHPASGRTVTTKTSARVYSLYSYVSYNKVALEFIKASDNCLTALRYPAVELGLVILFLINTGSTFASRCRPIQNALNQPLGV